MYEQAFHQEDLSSSAFLVTGGAGFIGSHLAEYLLKFNAGKVIVVDNLASGYIGNIKTFLDMPNFEFHLVDINDTVNMTNLMKDVDYVLHQAALGSVPRSIKDPLATHASNATGFLSVLEAARNTNIKRLVYASSSSVYGDSTLLPKQEDVIGKPKSPYAITKLMDEKYAEVYYRLHEMPVLGLRYFNIFGPRQNPSGPYAAAIPIFIMEALNDGKPIIFGDGEQSRDFTFVENAVQANIKAVFSPDSANGKVFNIACGEQYSLNDVLNLISFSSGRNFEVQHMEERKGDVRDSLANIERAAEILGYKVAVHLREGIEKTFQWYFDNPDYFQISS